MSVLGQSLLTRAFKSPALQAAVVAAMTLGSLPAVAAEVSSTHSQPATSSRPGAFALGAKVQEDRLVDYRGGAQTTVEHVGVVQDNSANHVVTGSNIVTEGSLAHSVGFPTLIQNTGTNVLIQSSTTIHVQLQ